MVLSSKQTDIIRWQPLACASKNLDKWSNSVSFIGAWCDRTPLHIRLCSALPAHPWERQHRRNNPHWGRARPCRRVHWWVMCLYKKIPTPFDTKRIFFTSSFILRIGQSVFTNHDVLIKLVFFLFFSSLQVKLHHDQLKHSEMFLEQMVSERPEGDRGSVLFSNLLHHFGEHTFETFHLVWPSEQSVSRKTNVEWADCGIPQHRDWNS